MLKTARETIIDMQLKIMCKFGLIMSSSYVGLRDKNGNPITQHIDIRLGEKIAIKN